MDRVASELDICWPRSGDDVLRELKTHLSSTYRHHVSSPEDLRLHPDLVAWIWAMYDRLSGPTPLTAGSLGLYDRIGAEFATARRAFVPILKALKAKQQEDAAAAKRATDALNEERRLREREQQLREQERQLTEGIKGEVSTATAKLAVREAELAMLDQQARRLAASLSSLIRRRVAARMLLHGIDSRLAMRPLLALGSVSQLAQKLTRKLRTRYEVRQQYWTIKYSGFFDANYYCEAYDDICERKVDPIWHYIQSGRMRGGLLNQILRQRISRRESFWYQSISSLYSVRLSGGSEDMQFKRSL